MKKFMIYSVTLIFGFLLFTSCEKDEIGGTATEKMAGEWYVTGVAVDEEGNVVFEDEDLFGIGHFHFDTYNSASNSMTEMWVNDNGNFWDFKAKVNIDLDAMTFQANDVQNEAYDSQFTITNGKILLGAATTPSGMPADSIVFNVTFSDDDYPETYDFASYRIAGFRYTGLSNDE